MLYVLWKICSAIVMLLLGYLALGATPKKFRVAVSIIVLAGAAAFALIEYNTARKWSEGVAAMSSNLALIVGLAIGWIEVAVRRSRS